MIISEQKRILGLLELELRSLSHQISNTADEQRQDELRQAYRDLEYKIEAQFQLIEDLEAM